MGDMSDLIAWSGGGDPFEDTDSPFSDHDPFNIYCKYCGQDGLHWNNLKDKWRLFDSKGKVHSCRPKVSASDFNF